MIPTIDPKVRHVGSSYLRGLNSDQLRQLEGAVVVQDSSDQPLVVIVTYETYLKMQGFQFACSRCGTASVGVIKGTPVFDCCPAGKTVIGPYHLDATDPELSSGKGKATVETRGIRPKGDSKR